MKWLNLNLAMTLAITLTAIPVMAYAKGGSSGGRSSSVSRSSSFKPATTSRSITATRTSHNSKLASVVRTQTVSGPTYTRYVHTTEYVDCNSLKRMNYKEWRYKCNQGKV